MSAINRTYPTTGGAPSDLDHLAGDGRCPAHLVQVLLHDPDLTQDLDERTAAHLRHRVVAPRLELEPGPWSPPCTPSDVSPGCLGLLVIDGLMTRCLRNEGRECPELLGAGDLLRPWDGLDCTPSTDPPRWKVLTPVTLAVLDERFAAIAGRWPSVFARLLERPSHRLRGLSFQLALAGMRRAEPRLLLILSHLADRWGRATPDGVVLPLPLTHELLGHLACIRRPTATAALHSLMRAGKLSRRADGFWVLPWPAAEDDHDRPGAGVLAA